MCDEAGMGSSGKLWVSFKSGSTKEWKNNPMKKELWKKVAVKLTLVDGDYMEREFKVAVGY